MHAHTPPPLEYRTPTSMTPHYPTHSALPYLEVDGQAPLADEGGVAGVGAEPLHAAQRSGQALKGGHKLQAGCVVLC